MAEQKCNGDHATHICALAAEGKMEQIKELAQNPQFLCANCGRVAASDDNLCNPVDLGQIGFESM